MIKIETQTLEIPVEIGVLKFTIDASDEHIKQIRSHTKVCLDKINKLEKRIEAKGIDAESGVTELEAILTDAYCILLGQGSFDKIYKQTPSLMSMINYYTQLANGLDTELAKRSNKNLPKYLQKKYKKTK